MEFGELLMADSMTIEKGTEYLAKQPDGRRRMPCDEEHRKAVYTECGPVNRMHGLMRGGRLP